MTFPLVWIREDSYHDDFPVAVYNQDGFIWRRFPSDEDAKIWIIANELKLMKGRPPGLREDVV